MKLVCHCGAVELELASAPDEITECNCSLCRRYGVRWAYYSLAQVRIQGNTDNYQWDGCSLEFHRCQQCGCLTHWAARDLRDRLGINANLLEPAVFAQARLRHLDGAVSEEYLD